MTFHDSRQMVRYVPFTSDPLPCGVSPAECPCAWHRGVCREAAEALVAIIRVVLPLAAAAQAGRCPCGAAIVPERRGWAGGRCYRCIPEDEVDAYRREKLELEARALLGVEYPTPVAPWERERRPARRAERRDRRAPEPVVSTAPADGPLRRRGERRES
jgi:hypothetical protein